VSVAAAVDRYPTRTGATVREPTARLDPVVWGDQTGPLGAGDVRAYGQDGFLAIDALVSTDEAAELLAEAHRLAADPALKADERTIVEPDSDEVRSIFAVHDISARFRQLIEDVRFVGIARQILGSDVFVHQSRINLKPGFAGKEFDWHSDFETWHAEDGMPAMRAVSISLALTANLDCNGALMIIPGSHRTFVSCIGETPEDHFRASLRRQQVGVPDHEAIRVQAERSGIRVLTGDPGSAVVFDSNCLHGSSSNITPFPRTNLFVVFNSVENALVDPFAARTPRPDFIANRTQPSG
jgi:ectoine hydroxylase